MVDVSDSIIMNMVQMIPRGSMDDVFILEKFSYEEVGKLMFIQSCVPIIKEFIFTIRVRQGDLKGPYMKMFEDLLSQMVFFLITAESKDPFTAEGFPVVRN